MEFARAGADVTQTFTYGSTEGMLEYCSFTVSLDKNQHQYQLYLAWFQPQQINQAPCDIARQVAREKNTLVAGGITQTKCYTYMEMKDKQLVQSEIRQNAEILLENNVDFIILEVLLSILPAALDSGDSISGMWRRWS